MVKTTIKYVRSLPYKSTASYFIKHIPDLIQLLILIALVLTFAEYRKANRLTQQSLAIAQKNIELSQQSIVLTQQSVSLSQKGMEFTEKSIEIAKDSLALTQKSMEATQQQLAYAQQANDISQKGLRANITPWIGIQITKYRTWSGDLDIEYNVTNNSDVPAHKVGTQCIIEGHSDIFDASLFDDTDDYTFAIMPKQYAPYKARMMTLKGGEPRQIVKEIESGKTAITILVGYEDALGNRNNFVQTLRAEDGVFKVDDEEYNPPRNKLGKILGVPLLPASK